ncbi:MAG TPA: O-antigen ligase family protein [Thermoanaerobaculia bacterium]|jgi:O-antigen ligase|nr:O-antigen ligase family protein [Thermoanaerobaculia bacterium]
MRERRSAARENADRRWYWLVAVTLLGAGVVLIPILYTGGALETFRLPKELMLRAEAIALALTAVFAATSPHSRWRDALRTIPRREWFLIGAIAVWCVVTTITSSNRALSEASLVTVAAALVVYISTRLIAPTLRIPMLFVVFAGAFANAIVVTLQELRIWNPFVFPPEIVGHGQSVGFLGNPNDVGTLLVGPAVVALVAAVTVRGWQRLLYGAAAIVLFGGVTMSQTRTAMIAFVAGTIVAVLLRPWKQALAAAMLLIILVVVAFRPSFGVREHFSRLVTAARQRDYPVLFSERAVPFLTAIEMLRANPVTGVGPGCFKYHFMLTRMALEKRYPASWTRGWPMNFGETHNDHLQVAAETGLPGYALLAGAMVLLAIPARRRRGPMEPRTTEQAVGHAIRAPLAATFFVVALAQFPLQTAAPRLMFLTLAAIAISWDQSDA